MTGATRALSAWARSVRYEDLPPDVVERVLSHTLDAVGALIVGSTRAWSRAVREYAEAESAQGSSTIAGLARRVRPEFAALANGTAAHGFEIDDYALPGLSHPGCVVVPTALAIAEQQGAGGRDIIAALAAGFETTVRFGEACTPSLTSDRGFHVTSALGVFGSVAVASRLTGLDPEQSLAAFGLAAAHAGGTSEFTRTGGDVKRLHAGMAAAAGIRSASIAALGLTAPTAAIEGERGFLRAFVEHARPEALTDGLGDTWSLRGLATKRWCVCAGLQAPLAALELIKAEGLAGDIERIVVGLDRATLAHVGHIGGRPRDMTEAQMSAHHAIALSIVAGGNDPEHYERAFSAEAVALLADRVELRVNDEAERLFPRRLVASVEVVAAAATVTRRAEAPGTPSQPMDSDAVAAKFRVIAAPIVGDAAAGDVVDAVAALREGATGAAILAAVERGLDAMERNAAHGSQQRTGEQP